MTIAPTDDWSWLRQTVELVVPKFRCCAAATDTMTPSAVGDPGNVDAKSDVGRHRVMTIWAAQPSLHDLYRSRLLAIHDDEAFINYAQSLIQKIH